MESTYNIALNADGTSTPLNTGLGFMAKSIIVDNTAPQWLALSNGRSIPPFTVGVIVAFPYGVQSAQASFTSPTGIVQVLPRRAYSAALTFTDAVLTPSSGQSYTQPAVVEPGGNLQVASFDVILATNAQINLIPIPSNGQIIQIYSLSWSLDARTGTGGPLYYSASIRGTTSNVAVDRIHLTVFTAVGSASSPRSVIDFHGMPLGGEQGANIQTSEGLYIIAGSNSGNIEVSGAILYSQQ
jgi:hypothetical protein